MIDFNQKKILSFSRKFIKKKNFFHSIISYFAIFEKNPGSYFLKSHLNKKYMFNFYISYTKHILGILNNCNLFYKENLNKKKFYDTIIISWAFKKNFNKEGNYFDKYLRKKSSKNQNIIWFLVYMDDKLPKKIDDNIIIVYKKKFLPINLIYYFIYIFKIIKKNLIGKKFLLKLNSFSAFSHEFIKIFNKKIDLKKIKNIFIVYEGQPFQKDLVDEVRKKNKKSKIIAYDHSAPPPLPLNLIYDASSPDYLLVTGKEQINFYSKYLMWPRSKLKIINTMRFNNEKKFFYTNKIFIPYELDNQKGYMSSIKKLIEYEKINLKNSIIQNHPLRLESRIHNDFINDLKKISSSCVKPQIFKKDKSSIFFGQTTAIIIALEFGLTCYHICSDPIFDSYSSALWKNLKVQKIDNFLFKYNLINENSFMKLKKNIKSNLPFNLKI